MGIPWAFLLHVSKSAWIPLNRPSSDAHTPNVPYPDLPRQVLRSLNLSHLLVCVCGGGGGSSTYFTLGGSPDKPQVGGGSVLALALDNFILAGIIEAFKVPEPRTIMFDHSLHFRILPNLYP